VLLQRWRLSCSLTQAAICLQLWQLHARALLFLLLLLLLLAGDTDSACLHFTQRQRPSSSSAKDVASSPSSSSSSTFPSPSPAAVLVGLFAHPVSGAVHVLLTLRSSALSSHQGEVSLPGGKREAVDADDAATACREAEEEVGLSPAHCRVIGLMDRVRSKAGLMVRPVVAVIPAPQLGGSAGLVPSAASFSPVLNAAEVSAVFSLPLSCFLSSTGHRSADVPLAVGGSLRMHFITQSTADWLSAADAAPAVTAVSGAGSAGRAASSEAQRPQREFVVWGFTAHVLIVAARIAFARAPDFAFLPALGINSSSRGSRAEAVPALHDQSKL
jgi:ADP-ribose pyrophosphatase YjhB (NUDIX family)